MPDQPVQPVDIEIEHGVALRIQWADGIRSTIPLGELRKACPCAGCRVTREAVAQKALPVVAAIPQQEQMVMVDRAALVGRYALRIVWGDGHDTGLYEYELLRRLGRLEE